MSRLDELPQSSKPTNSTPPTLSYEKGSDSSHLSSGFESDDQDDKDSLELELEKAVFGDEPGFHQRLNEHSRWEDNHVSSTAQRNVPHIRRESQDNIQDLEDADLFVLDAAPSQKLVAKTSKPESQASKDNAGAAWYDSDDERIVVSLQTNPRLRKLRVYEDEDLVNGVEYTKRLRRQFEHLNPVPGWAVQSSHEVNIEKSQRGRSTMPQLLVQGSKSDDELSVDSDDLSSAPLARFLQQPSAFIQQQQSTSKSGKRKLRSEVIDIQRTKDSAVTSLEFHPYHAILLSSGPASTISLHHVSPRPPNPNPLLTSLHVRSIPLATSSFLPPDGSKVFFAGRRRYLHSWDLQTGRVDKISRIHGHEGSQRKGGGQINVLDARTKQWTAEVRVEGKGGVADFAWWGNGDGMTVLGKGGEAVEWEGKQKKIVARWVDEGAVGTTVVAMGGRGTGAKDLGDDRWVAVGSSSGIVNVYDRKNWEARDMPAKPKPVRAFDQLTTPTSHLSFSPDGQLMVMASRWKRDALRIGRITAVAFAPTSEMLAVANEQGRIRLFEIRA
ncbi:MAG: hypothetical protein LQ352_004199 [Teloschistes flavicans]|nr:MAG: hypothetical protein LQ352_004199 [Teloschistes flavicans]